MAWIESHQSLREHPKLYKLARVLNLTKHGAIGLLIQLWWWACDYAEDGDISRYDAEQLAKAVEWEQDPSHLLTALVESGFIDAKEGKRTIHDWLEYRLHYDLMRQRKDRIRKQIRQRVKRFRNAQRNAPVTPCNAANQPKQTNLNKPTKPTVTDLTLFDRFWQAYPHKVGKGAAQQIWQRLNPSEALLEKMLASIERAKQLPQWLKDNGQFIPHPATWLNQLRWEDQPFVSPEAKPPAVQAFEEKLRHGR